MVKKADINFGKTAKDYAKYRAGFPDSFFERLVTDGWLENVRTVLDLGTGTGTIARGLAQKGMSVVGVDPSEELLEQAKELDRMCGVIVQYSIGTAEAAGCASQSFDLVIAGQCWHWFDQAAALKEIGRVLRPGGMLVVAYFDWIATNGNPVDEMYRLRRKYNPSWKSTWPLGFYPQEPGDLKFSGFQSVRSFLYEEDIPYTHESWRGRMRAYSGIGGSLPKDVVDEFDREFAEVLKEKFPGEVMHIPHKVWAEGWVRV